MVKKILITCLSLLIVFAGSDCARTDTADSSETSEIVTDSSETTDEIPAPILETPDIHALDANLEYRASAETLFTFNSSDPEFTTVQGAYFDGEQYIVAMTHTDAESYEKVRLLALDKDGKRLRESKPLPLDHANNLSFQPDRNALLVTHCQSPDYHYCRYSFVDISDFSIIETADLTYPFFAMAYSHERKQYASGEWGGDTLDIWDENMNNLKSYSVECPESLSQGVFCDNDGIYFVRSSQNGAGAEIRIYDWDCNLTRIIPLETMPNHIEPENINIVDGEVYVTGNDWQEKCGTAFKLTFCAVSELQS